MPAEEGRGADRVRLSPEDLRRRHAGRVRSRPRDRGRRVDGPGRPVGLRQDDGPADGGRARGDHRRRDPDRRPHRQRPDAEGTQHRDGLPELRSLSAHDRRGQPRLQPQAPQDAEEGDPGAGPARGEHPPDRGLPQAQAARSLGRSASAGRHGARDRPRAGGLSDGRAALEPRREAAGTDAGRDPPAAAAARCDDDLCHARPGRGDDDGRPRRGHERRAPAAGRHAAGALRQACQRVRRRLHRLSLDQPGRGQAGAEQRALWPSSSATTA